MANSPSKRGTRRRLGEAAARLLSAEGARVVLGGRAADRIRALAGELNIRGGKAVAVAAEVTHSDLVSELPLS